VKFLKTFLSNNKFEFYENFDISTLSSIKIGERVSLAVFPKNISQLTKLIENLYLKKIYFKIIGNASNVLFVDSIRYPLIITSKMQDEISVNDCEVEFSAGMQLSKVCETLKKYQLSGFEGLAHIPATIGGAIKNGAGAFGFNIFDKLISIKAFVFGKVVTIFRNQINFKHHYSNLNGVFVLSAKFLFEKKDEYDIIKNINKFAYLRTKTQPASLSLGSVYQKTFEKSAGFFIERAGLKGKKIGGIMVSNKHANFFVNDGSGTALDFLRLAAFVESSVETHFGVNLLPEIEKVGDKNEIDSRLSYTFK